MTNEQLAEFITSGGSDELIPLLWNRVQRLLYLMADKEYRRRAEQFDRCGVTAWDLKQICYTDVFLKALERYNSDKGLQFTTYLTYPFMRAVETVLGVTNGRPNTRPLDNCISLEVSGTNSEDVPISLGDIIPDEGENPEQKLFTNESYRALRSAVSRLDKLCRTVIVRHYFYGETFQEIADRLGVSYSRIWTLNKNGLEKLRNDRKLRRAYYG